MRRSLRVSRTISAASCSMRARSGSVNLVPGSTSGPPPPSGPDEMAGLPHPPRLRDRRGAPAGAGARAPFVVTGDGRRAFEALADAVAAIGGGRGTIMIAPGRYRQCAVQNAGVDRLCRARAGQRRSSTASPARARRRSCSRGASARVEGIVFQNMPVAGPQRRRHPARSGRLMVAKACSATARTASSTANDHRGTIRVERSTFSRLGGARGMRAARIRSTSAACGALIVTRSRFERGTGGHYVKSRAAPHRGHRFAASTTAQGHATNYMIDLSNGATARSPATPSCRARDKENYSAFIMVAAEGDEHSSPASRSPTTRPAWCRASTAAPSFVADGSGEAITIGNNRLDPQIARFERR